MQIQAGHLVLRTTIPAANRLALDYFKDHQYEAHEEIYQNTSDYMTECLEQIEPYVCPNQSFDQGHS